MYITLFGTKVNTGGGVLGCCGKEVLGVTTVLLDQWSESTAEDAADAEEQSNGERAPQ
jgi:hypothetical protein